MCRYLFLESTHLVIGDIFYFKQSFDFLGVLFDFLFIIL